MTIKLNVEEINTLLKNMLQEDESQVRTLALLDSPDQAEFADQDTGELFYYGSVRRLYHSARALKFHCYSCGEDKLISEWTRDSSNLDLCAACLTEAELENAHSDGHHDATPDPDCPQCDQPAPAA